MRYLREEIYGALFTLLKDSTVFRTVSRRPIPPTNVDPSIQPALFMEQTGENPVYVGRGVPYKWELDVMLHVYVYEGDNNAAPSIKLNELLDEIERLFPIPQAGIVPQTLGGLVSEARLLGEGRAFSGSIANQAFAYVPIRIVAT